MLLNWFKKKIIKYPDFYLQYLDLFEEDKINENSYVVFDCETTGLNPDKDKILSIGAIKIENDEIIIKKTFDFYLLQEFFNKEAVAIHGLRKQENYQVSEQEAILEFLKYIGNTTLVGHHINFDIEMINMALKRLEAGKLKNESMDTNAMYKKLKYLQEDQNSSLDELAKIYKIRSHDRHTAVGDSYITALLFLKLKKKLKI